MLAPVGLVMLAAGAALVLVALVLLVPIVLRVRRRALSVRTSVLLLRSEGAIAVEQLRSKQAETRALLAPWRRILRWVRNPLVVAAIQWHGRRRARVASARHHRSATASDSR